MTSDSIFSGSTFRLRPEHLRWTDRMVISSDRDEPLLWVELQRRPLRELGGIFGSIAAMVLAAIGISQVITGLPGVLEAWHLAVMAGGTFAALLLSAFFLQPERRTLIFSDEQKATQAMEVVQLPRHLMGTVHQVRIDGRPVASILRPVLRNLLGRVFEVEAPGTIGLSAVAKRRQSLAEDETYELRTTSGGTRLGAYVLGAGGTGSRLELEGESVRGLDRRLLLATAVVIQLGSSLSR